MDDHARLLDAIAAAPADDLLRLVYADWIEERGEVERAAFIRAHVELARTEPMAAGFNALATRVSELFRARYRDWYGDLAVPGETRLPDLKPPPRRRWFRRPLQPAWWLADTAGRWVFHGAEITIALTAIEARGGGPADHFVVTRGLVGAVDLSLGSVLPPAVFARHPIRLLSLQSDRPHPAGFAFDGPHLGRVRVLDLPTYGGSAYAGAVEAVVHSSHWHNLDTVHVPVCPYYFEPGEDGYVHPAGLRAIARSPLARQLKTLRLGFVDDDEAPRATAATFDALNLYPADGGLTELALLHNDSYSLQPDGYTRLAAAPVARTLQRLDVTECSLDDAQLAELAGGPTWECLTHLNLAYNHFTDAGLITLAASTAFPRLRVLDLSHTDIIGFGLIVLAGALADGPLEELILSGLRLDSDLRRTLVSVLGNRVRFD